MKMHENSLYSLFHSLNAYFIEAGSLGVEPHFPDSALTRNWSQKPELVWKPRHSAVRCGQAAAQHLLACFNFFYVKDNIVVIVVQFSFVSLTYFSKCWNEPWDNYGKVTWAAESARVKMLWWKLALSFLELKAVHMSRKDWDGVSLRTASTGGLSALSWDGFQSREKHGLIPLGRQTTVAGLWVVDIK